jgi:hypothetical protein
VDLGGASETAGWKSNLTCIFRLTVASIGTPVPRIEGFGAFSYFTTAILDSKFPA